jgi:hypothetical protein
MGKSICQGKAKLKIPDHQQKYRASSIKRTVKINPFPE